MLLLHRRALAAMSFAAGAALGLPATGAAQEETVRLSGQTVAVYNLAGEITLTPGSGSDVAIDVSLRGADASQLEVRAGPVDTRRSNWDTVEALRIVYPGDRILYEGLDGQTRLRVHDDGTFWGGRGDRGMREVEISDRGAGLRASANLAVRVPTGKRVLIVLGAGMIEATNVDGNLYLDTGSGGIRTAGTTGVLNLDTGSGDVVVDGAEGDINIDTGSGDVNVRSVRGPDLNIDTGSGNVTVDGVEAPELSIDT
ncbi:MAG: DUF4097 domain-containing protein, partial [Gemmatimonadota bacterium]|nr:DUF4097 domain-containing protein [Gemmatimonadota bacterium]